MTETLCLESGVEVSEPQERVELSGSIPDREAMRPQDLRAVPNVEGVTVIIPSEVGTVAAATLVGEGTAACTELEDADENEEAVSGSSTKFRSQLTEIVVSGHDGSGGSEQITSLARSGGEMGDE
ncbi:hypothetical protein GN958_ATG13252 [Phytophthora infestans]|uniref:Uncharacterized protein n=1 Tax=Phytophthora infestans TaxID=4787 RepID=A0A8S9UAS9_PHYIN|nr:hypothetical protein GN958_ATG13252 [Phytophthora infestans]